MAELKLVPAVIRQRNSWEVIGRALTTELAEDEPLLLGYLH